MHGCGHRRGFDVVRRVGRPLFSALCAWALLGASVAQAQQSAPSLTFDLQTFHHAATAGGLLSLEGTGIGTHLQPRGGALLMYRHDPLIYERLAGAGDLRAVGSRVDTEFNLSMGFYNRAELGLALPVVLYQHGETVEGAPEPARSGLGDLRIVPKVRLWGSSARGLSLAVSGELRLPTAGDDTLAGAGWTFEPTALLAYAGRRFDLLAALGYRVQPQRVHYGLEVDDQLLAGVGGRYRFGPFAALVTLRAATAAEAPLHDTQRTPVQAALGLSYHRSGISVTLAGGPGLVPGHGAPTAHVGLALGYAPGGIDSDGDRIQDAEDACPTEPEDRDGHADGDGCPDTDNDNDGIPDARDKCPDLAEDKDNFQDEDGCPEADNDKDGIPDKSDMCPNEAEDHDGYADHDGCPEPDNDNDGIDDKKDKCPNRAEVYNNIEDEDGCPEPDQDSDGILDSVDRCPLAPEDKNGLEDEDGCPEDPDKDGIPTSKDRCPTEPETFNNYHDEDGCPDSRQPKVTLRRRTISTSEPIYFESDGWKIKPRFKRLLREMARTINANPRIKVVYVEGHADERGTDKYNQWLSFYRATQVMLYLRKQGVKRTRLRAMGWGEQRPMDENTTEEGRARNRSVVFHVIYRKPKGKGGAP